MKTVSSITELQKLIKSTNLSPLGFIPTMGALHMGHLSLVSNAISQCPVVVVSIYVNPNQFNDKQDLKNYPRTIEADKALLGTILRETDIIFTPDDREIYPVKDKRVFDFGNLDRVMEAVHRPGHFNGVAQVVSRLFEIVGPDFAFFGQKDFQQLAVIRALVRQTGDKVRIIGNPIVREDDGLAMSSRNRLLEPEIRKNAGVICKAIFAASRMVHDNDIPRIKGYVRETVEKPVGFEVEYFEIVDEKDLVPVRSTADFKKGTRYFGCIAVKAGKIRLIDNVEIPLNQSKG